MECTVTEIPSIPRIWRTHKTKSGGIYYYSRSTCCANSLTGCWMWWIYRWPYNSDAWQEWQRKKSPERRTTGSTRNVQTSWSPRYNLKRRPCFQKKTMWRGYTVWTEDSTGMAHLYKTPPHLFTSGQSNRVDKIINTNFGTRPHKLRWHGVDHWATKSCRLYHPPW